MPRPESQDQLTRHDCIRNSASPQVSSYRVMVHEHGKPAFAERTGDRICLGSIPGAVANEHVWWRTFRSFARSRSCGPDEWADGTVAVYLADSHDVAS